MSEIILYGPPQSSYVRTARMVCIEKGAPHRLEPLELGSDAHERLHPYKRVPSMRHGDVELWETQAIAHYVDAAFEGPALTPSDPAARGRMEQWISAINCYIYGDVIRDYALQYFIPKLRGVEPDRRKIEEGLPKLERDFALLDEGYARQPYLGGESLCLADLFVAPIVQTVGMCPEGQAVLERTTNLRRAYQALSKRESFKAVHAPT
ncbi:MAG TPA: glutathione S-transferase family protein [Polyangiaceae bacterium]|jgi:glutathione S-transferase|nr:glutathione S-transferase family protein [Polyangiaceae bacterium]